MMINQSNYDETRNSVLDEIRNQGLKENNALRVYTYLKSNERARRRRLPRWIWELLQNAHDASTAHEEPLIVNIKYSPGELVFSHNGSSFKVKQIFNLIYHGSTKADEEEAIGEYGSGFLTTHLLSPEIRVLGQLDDEQDSKRWFDFYLTRKSDSPDELLELMDEAWEDFKKPLPNEESSLPNSFTTQFVYPITGAEAEEAVEKGIETLKQCAPLVVVFNPKFSVIDINDHGEILCFEAIQRPTMDTTEIQEITVEARQNGNSSKNKYFLASSGDKKTSVAAPLESNSSGSECQFVKNMPRLFKAFPLVGTELFSFPAVVNSFKFTVTEARDDVYLAQDKKDEANIGNQTVMEEAFKLLINLIEYASSKRCHHVHQWAKVPPIQHNDVKTQEWLRTRLKENFIEKIRKTSIVLNTNDNPIDSEMVKLLLAESETGIKNLWDLVEGIKGQREFLPKPEEAMGWCNAVKSWADVYQGKPMSLFSEARNGEKLAPFIEANTRKDDNYGRIEDLQKLLRDGVSAVEWLNRLHDFFNVNGLREAVREYHIVPDQADNLEKISDLHRDQDIDEELKEIAELLDWRDSQNNWTLRELLRDKQLTSLAEEVGKGNKDNKEVLGDLIEKLKERAEDNDSIDDNFKKASVRLFAWIVGQEDWNSLRGFPMFVKDIKSDSPVFDLPTARAGKPPLAPVSAWPEDLQQFSELFPPDRILADDFFEKMSVPETWKQLDEQGLIRTNMIIPCNEIDIKALSPELYKDNEDHEAAESIGSVTDFVDRDLIMNRVRDSRERAYLFWQFLTEWLIKEDSQDLEVKTAKCKFCGGDISHEYYLTAWLEPVRNNQWIRQENGRVNPGAQSLASLLRDNGWKLNSLDENPCIIKLLKAIGVSESDLRLEFIAGHEETRDEVVKLATALYSSTPNNLNQLNELVHHVTEGNLGSLNAIAQDLQEDEKLSEYLEKRRKNRHTWDENQRLGSEVEKLVKRILEDEGFSVEPTGTGSDFEISEEAFDLITLNINKEDKNWLVEVKSTRTEGDHQNVRMTSTQAQTAVEEKEKFLLCVVPLGQEDITPETVRENMRFVQNIGNRLTSLCDDLDSLEDLREEITADTSLGVKLVYEAVTKRIQVNRSVWETEGFPLEDLVEYLK